MTADVFLCYKLQYYAAPEEQSFSKIIIMWYYCLHINILSSVSMYNT